MEWQRGNPEVARQDQIVLDSSVIVKWFTQEEGSDRAVELMESFVRGSLAILASSLSLYEVANALRYKSDFKAEDVRNSLAQLMSLRLEVKALTPRLVGEAARIAFEGNVTFYDALPVALAQLEKTSCITADRSTQFARLSPRGYPIRLL